jgi:Uma2 family endonuclease
MATTIEQMAELMPDATQLLSDEPEMESTLHYAQLALLVSCLEWYWRERDDFFIGANLTVYYSRQQLKTKDFRGPDFFLVLDAQRRHRNSWVVWEEDGKYPDLIIELLSDSTADIDREIKKALYQNRFRTPEYFWFSPVTLEFEGFRLDNRRYVEIPADERGWRWSQVLNLYLGIRDGRLRYITASGELVPTLEEATAQAMHNAAQALHNAEQARQTAEQALQTAREETERAEQEARRARQETRRAEQEARRAEQETQRAEQEASRAARLAEKLRELGIDPEAF